MLTDLDALFGVNPSQAKGISAIYQVLLNGIPSIEGFIFLINENNSSNFGAGPGPVFNDENIFINIMNALVQGNSDARKSFEVQASGVTLVNKITALYGILIPDENQSVSGLSFLTRPEGLAFYEQVADERGIEGSDGAAIVAMASLIKIVVEQNIGIGNAVQDFIDAVKNGSALLPSSSQVFTELEDADGTDFDADDLLPGDTFQLTRNIDLISGTDGNDLILGVSTTLTTDIIEGKGGVDILRVIDSAGAVFTPTLNTVENLEVIATHTSTTIFNLGLSRDVSNITLSESTGSLRVNDATQIHDLVVSNSTDNAAVFINYSDAVVSGADDTMRVRLEGASLGGGLAIDDIETVNITLTGTNSILNIIGGNTINIEGSGTLSAAYFASSNVSSYNATTATGVQRITFESISDVSIVGGSANDVFDFGSTFTSADTVNGGNGTDFVALLGGEYAAIANDTLKGLNAFTSVELIGFTSVGTTIDRNTLFNADIKAIGFNTDTGTDIITNTDSLTTYAFASQNSGDAIFTMRAGNNALTLELSGSSTQDADIGNLNTGTATSVQISTLGSFVVGLSDGSTNNIGVVTNAIDATFKLIGSAATSIDQFTSSVVFDASSMFGKLTLSTSNSDDMIIGGNGVNIITGLNGIDEINITASMNNQDIIRLDGITKTQNRDEVIGFKSGSNGDVVLIGATETSAQTMAGNSANFQEITTNTGTVNFLTIVNDVLVFNFNIAGNLLGDKSANSLNGTNLLAEVGSINVSAGADKGYILAFQQNDSYIYHIEDDGDGSISANEISLIGTFTDSNTWSVSNIQIV